MFSDVAAVSVDVPTTLCVSAEADRAVESPESTLCISAEANKASSSSECEYKVCEMGQSNSDLALV